MKIGCNQINYRQVGDWINIDVSSHGMGLMWNVKFYKQINDQIPEQIYEFPQIGPSNKLVFINYQFEDFDKGIVKFWATTKSSVPSVELATSDICTITIGDEPPLCEEIIFEFVVN